VELFCQTIYQNGSNFPNGVVHGVEASQTASLVKWSRAKQGLSFTTFDIGLTNLPRST
jgi:hypothetical protein